MENAPDIQGFAILSGCPQGAADSLLARIDFLGNVFLDSCTLFSTSPPPSKTTFPPRRAVLTQQEDAEEAENMEEDLGSEKSWVTASSSPSEGTRLRLMLPFLSALNSDS